MNLKTLAAAACLSLAAAAPSQAATFDFAWSAADPIPSLYSDDPSLRAVGTFDLDVESGAFGNDNISNIMIDLTGNTFGSMTMTMTRFYIGSTAGTISADGGSATFSSISFLVDGPGLPSFGFFQFRSDTPTPNVYLVLGFGAAAISYIYASAADAQGSFSATTPISAIPLPAGGLLLLSTFGGVAALKRRKKRAA
jgi:hypothetical protein